jgi:hypothetical protein
MNKAQELTDAAKASAKALLDFLARQAQQVASLVVKKPKSPALSWDSIIDDCFPDKKHVHVGKASPAAHDLPELNPQLALLPPALIDELIEAIQRNSMDEIPSIRLYEKLFECEVKIMNGHVHFYKVGVETFDFTVLKSRLLNKLTEHKRLLVRSRSQTTPTSSAA